MTVEVRREMEVDGVTFLEEEKFSSLDPNGDFSHPKKGEELVRNIHTFNLFQ